MSFWHLDSTGVKGLKEKWFWEGVRNTPVVQKKIETKITNIIPNVSSGQIPSKETADWHARHTPTPLLIAALRRWFWNKIERKILFSLSSPPFGRPRKGGGAVQGLHLVENSLHFLKKWFSFLFRPPYRYKTAKFVLLPSYAYNFIQALRHFVIFF